MDILINAANVLYVAAYFTMDLLRLRLLTVTAATCLALYFYNQPEPMLNVVMWNVFFIVLNLVQLGRLLVARQRGRGPLTPSSSTNSASPVRPSAPRSAHAQPRA